MKLQNLVFVFQLVKEKIVGKKFKLIKCDVSKYKQLKKNIFLKKKINYVWLLAANSDIQAGIRDRNVDLVKTFMTTKISLDFFSKYLFKNSKINLY